MTKLKLSLAATAIAGLGFASFAISVAAPAIAADSAAPDSVLAAARASIRQGDTAAALLKLSSLLEAKGEIADVARLLALQAYDLSGRYEEARALAGKVKPDADPRLIAATAEFWTDLGEEKAARTLLDAALAAHRGAPSTALASLHLGLAALAAGRGEREDERNHCREVPAPNPADSTAAAAPIFVSAGRAAWGRGAFQEAKNSFERAAALDPSNDQARLLAAALLLEKHETKLARSALGPVLFAWRQNPEALLLIAHCNLADGVYRGAEEACRAALAVNPRQPGARAVLASIQLIDKDLRAASSSIDTALAVAPGLRELRSLQAAVLLLSGDREGSEREASAILAEAPHYAEVYVTIGDVLERLRRYREAGDYYQRALAVDPDNAGAANALGLSAMRDGREEEAAQWLDRGFALDRYNIRTYNMRLLLEKLAGYRRVETAHFTLRLADADMPFAPLLGPYLESVYNDLCKRFGFTPEVKTMVEVFAEPELLSARLIGLPGIEGIPAACFGPVIAMDSPRLWKGNINWQTITRHEFGHVLALTRTAKQVPFWFTEGLSVVLEGSPATLEKDRLARWALAEGELIPFVELDHGFTRAKSPMQRSLAYYEAAFAVRRLIDHHGGFPTVLAILDDYAAGRSTAQAIAAHLGTSEAGWAAEVDSTLRDHIKEIPIWPLASAKRLQERVQQSSSHPGDLEARALMAEEWLQAGELETAVSEALAVLEADSTHVMARRILGEALFREGETVAAATELEKVAGQGPPNYLVLRDLGMVYAELGEDEAAIGYLEQAIHLYPADPEPYRKLAEVHRRSGRLVEAGTMLAEAASVGESPYDDLISLAQLAKDNGLDEIEALALERGLALRPFAPETLERLARLYKDAGNAALAVRTYEALCLLERDNRDAHQALVELALTHGPRETARRFAERLRELDPQSELARRALSDRP